MLLLLNPPCDVALRDVGDFMGNYTRQFIDAVSALNEATVKAYIAPRHCKSVYARVIYYKKVKLTVFGIGVCRHQAKAELINIGLHQGITVDTQLLT